MLDRQGRPHDALRVNLLLGHFLKAALNDLGGLRQAMDDSVDHGFGPLAQCRLIQLANRIRGLGNDDIGATLCRRQASCKVREGMGGDHDGRNAALLESRCDVATPRRA